MDERRMQRRVGWVVLFTFTFLGVMLVMNNPAARLFSAGGYEISIDVPNAPGVGVNTPVRKDGVLIGRVSDLDWTDEGVRLRVRIDREDVLLYKTDKAEVAPSSIFGDAVIKFTRQAHKPDEPPLLADSVVQGTSLPDPLSGLIQMQQNLEPSMRNLGVAGEKVAILADKINLVLGDDIGKQRIQEVMDELVMTLRDFRRTTNNFDQLIGDDELRTQLTQALREFPLLMSDARRMLEKAGGTMEHFDQAIASVYRNSKNIEGLTAPLGERGEEMADLLISAVDNLDIVLADLSRFTKSLNSSNGTIGLLVRDPSLYNNANLLLKNTNVVVTRIYEFTKDFRPIVNDIRVFTDKIAREPGRFIGGAVKPSIQK